MKPAATPVPTVLAFWKMHGLGNDYVLIDNRNGAIADKELGNLAEKLCRRKFSIGADGMLVVCNSAVADAKMRIFNADGSEAEMCGNGIRCFAKYCYEEGIAAKTELDIETLAGIKKTWLKPEDGKVAAVTVDMGKPVFEREQIPVLGKGRFIDEGLEVDGTTFKATCLSIGNPHCVILVDDVDSFPVAKFGPKIENHRLFPNRINAEFVQVVRHDELKARIWERGVGETLASGTGASASVVAANTLGKIGDTCTVHLSGGDLNIKYSGGNILMTGPAEKAFEGVISLATK